MLPGSGVKLCVGRCGDVARDAEQGTEGVERIEPPVEAEGEFVEVGLQVLVTDPVMDAVQPRFQVCEDEMDDWQILLGDLRIAPFSDGEVFVAALGKAGVAAPVVGDERRARHNGALNEAAERLRAAVRHDGEPNPPGIATTLPLVELGARLALANLHSAGDKNLIVDATAFAARPAANPGFIDFDVLAGPAADPVLIRAHHPRAELVEDLERRLVARQAKLSPKLHGRHAGCLAGHQSSHIAPLADLPHQGRPGGRPRAPWQPAKAGRWRRLYENLAREMISRTRFSKLLQPSGDVPAAAMQALCLTLVQLSQLIVDIPEVAGLEINPLVVDHRGAVAVGAQILIAPPTEASQGRLAIRPYPKELEEEFVLANGLKVLLRPIRPEDAPAQHEFHDKCSPQDMELRFFHRVRTLSHLEMARLTQIDYDREMAFIATAPKEDGSGWETFGTVRTFTDLDNETAEYAVLVRSDIKRQGLGRKLMRKMVRYCRSRGTRQIVGRVRHDNKAMFELIRSLGFESNSRVLVDENIMEVVLDLQQPLRQADA